MLNPEHFAITLARAVDLFRTHPHAIADQKTALRALLALSRLGAVQLSVENHELLVEDVVIPRTLPAIASLTSTLEQFGVSEIRFAQHAAAGDLLQLLRTLAALPEQAGTLAGVDETMGAQQGRTISVLSIKPETLLPGEEPVRVTEAFAALVEDMPPIRRARHGAEPAGSPLARLRAKPYAGNVLDRLVAVTDDVADAVAREDVSAAIEAIEAVLDLEAEAPDGPATRSYGIAIRRLLSPEVLAALVLLVPDRELGPAAARAMRRAGAEGTGAMLKQLAEAPTMAERLAYFEALRHIREGTDLVVRMLDHHQWYVVRNVADLVGELGLESAVPALGGAVTHYDARVQQSAAAALAKIASNAALDTLRRALHGSDAEVKMAVARAVRGKGASLLALPLAAAVEEEEDPSRQREYYQALGRIGSSDAVRALLQAIEPGGRWFKRKPAGRRVAAVEGLALTGGPAVRGTLERLQQDRDPRVREAAGKALGRLQR